MSRLALARTVAAVLAFAASVAFIVLAPHWDKVGDIKGAQMGTYFIAIVGLNIVTGYTGQISLAQGAFMAVGGYTTAFLVTHGVRDLWTIPIAALVAGVFGFLLGIPALRLSGLYLALVTFGLAVAMPDLIAWDKLSSVTSGGKPIQLFGSKHLLGQGFNDVSLLGHTLSFNRAVYYLTWALALVLFVLAWLLLRGAPGRAFRAVRDSEIAAASSGVNIAAYKTVAFAIGAAYAGVAGSLLVIAVAFADPQSFPAKLSLTILVGAVIAGLGSLWGVLLGAAFVEFLPVVSVHVSKAPGRARCDLRGGPDPDRAPASGRHRGPAQARSFSANNSAIHSVLAPVARLFLIATAALLVLGIPVAFGGTTSDPGITPTSIHIGGTAPLTGVAQGFRSVAEGANAYFKYVNARGGVNGRKINYEYEDDQYIPSETVRATRDLVENKDVFAIFNSLGTEQNEAIRPYLNQKQVPQLFVATGATEFGRDYRQYPWSMAYQPTYIAEGAMYGTYLRRTMPKAKIAILYQDDSYGADLIAGLQRGLGPKKGNIVSKVGYAATDDNVQSQIARLRSSKAGVLMLFATPKFVIQAYQYVNGLGWKPKIFVNAVSSASNVMVLSSSRGQNKRVEGSISIVFLKDPERPEVEAATRPSCSTARS